ncbi:glial cell line-derived neurotrophic factor-like [Eucyclogobius newberryi]|uniref:glial cell line-derived neurotrophic factor-like n=1 Tax=Eucyclogobius newberryi TaxID=166745 RepID=UPI003B5CF876
MKLWHRLCTCVMLLLGSVHAAPVAPRGARAAGDVDGPLESVRGPGGSPPGGRSGPPGKSAGSAAEDREEEMEVGEKYIMEELLLDDYADLIKITISRIHRSSASSSSSSPSPSDTSSRTRRRRAKRKGPPAQQRRGAPGKRARGRRARNQGCVLKQVQLNVTDLALGYRSGEEMIFRYCAGPCRKSETNYDKILSNLVRGKRLAPKDRPAQACCRPVAFDDDLSFLDDDLVYHTMRKHSARKCACV